MTEQLREPDNTERILFFVPTYEERENAPALIAELLSLNLPADLLFVDDASPDGTGGLLDELASKEPRLHVIHRTGKLGIGTAHQVGIRWAYEHHYRVLVTMDCDFTHKPADIPRLLEVSSDFDVVVGSRYLRPKSLETWNLHRKMLTRLGHFATYTLLGMPYDASGAFRVYRLDRIPVYAFNVVHSSGYAFFFESLHVLHRNKFRIGEVAIVLPARTYGHSKMSLGEVSRSIGLLLSTFFVRVFNAEKLRIVAPLGEQHIDRTKSDPQGWDDYWEGQKRGGRMVYDAIASLYRKLLIRPNLNRFVRRYFPRGAELLHAGCGGGQVDRDLQDYAQITGLDISVNALNYYRQNNGESSKLLHGSIFEIPVAAGSYDGAYNLGVMEHFTEEEITRILGELYRVLKPGGRIVLFWPPEYGLSVRFFKLLERVFQLFGKRDSTFHPPEVSRIRSKDQVTALLERSGFRVEEYYFGPRDLFTQVMIAAAKV
ncbi:MAG: glycosyltransferase [Bdellovibrionota bacterium]